MSTVAEIEDAIAKLPAERMFEIAAWLDDYRAMIVASEELFLALDAEESADRRPQWSDA